ncbi:MAG: SBBP repeat-containing protein [Acidobacteria bacterium]|nr:SBBP repeat-containing protein [Acidobacteriota bacterium]
MRPKITRRSFALLLLLTILNINLPAASDRIIVTTNDRDPTARQTVEFEQNVGQFDPQVRYVARSAGSMLFLTGDKAMYVLPFTDLNEPKAESEPGTESPAQRFHAVSMSFTNANSDIAAAADRLSEHRTNYFLGSDESRWRSDVPNFGEVRFENVYNGVSTVWYGLENGATQYDLVVAPFTDAGRIELKFDGAESISVNEEGSLLINTPAGTLIQNRPFTYQTGEDSARVEVPSSFAVDGTTVRFALGEYDRSRELVIDPTVTYNALAFSTFVGSFGDDIVSEIAVDSNGCSYITGRTTSISYPTTTGTFDTTSNGSEDVFVTKVNSSGTGLVYSTYLGGPFFDEGRAITVDPNGNVYLGGTASISFPTTVGAIDTTFGGGADVFITKLNAAGNSLNYSTFLGESSIEYADAIATDSAGNAYIGGRAGDAPLDYPTTAGAFDTTHNGIDDAFLTKINDTGTAIVYSTFLGGSDIDGARAVWVTPNGEAILAGFTTDAVTDLPTTAGSYDPTHNGVTDFFVTRFDPTGSSLVYSTFIGGPGIDNLNSLAVDEVGSVYVTGIAATGFPITAGAIDTTAVGSNEIGISKLNAAGTSLVYSTFFGGTQAESANGIAVDRFGNVYIAGSNTAGDYPTTVGPYDSTFNGASDAVVTILNHNATSALASTYFGGSGTDSANDIALDANGNIYIAGQTTNAATPLPTTPDAYQTFTGGLIDAFVGKFGDFTIGGRVIDTSGNPMANVMVAMSGQVSGNILTGPDGQFGFTDTVPGEPHSVTATRSGYVMNPAIFNIAALANNRELIFVASPGSPSGGSGGTLLFQNLSYNKGENGSSILLTVQRTGIISSQVTVDYQTAGGTALPIQDFQPISGTLTFGPLETNKTISIPIVNDQILEPRETLTVTLDNPTNNADIENGRQTTTISLLDDDLGSGDLLISEFRTRGRLGANDEYIKIFNPNDFDLTIFAADGSSGVTLAHSDTGTLASIATIPNLVTIRSRGHYLLTNNSPSGGFSLIDFPSGIGTMTTVGDQTFSVNLPDGADIVLQRTSDPLQFGTANKVDSIGFAGSEWAEGNGLAPTVPANRESCYARRLISGGFQDTDDNRSDLMLVDTHAAMFTSPDQSRVISVLGSPAPETSESLRMMTPAEVTIVQSGTEVFDPSPVENGPNGTLTIFRTVTNNTSSPISAMRLRAIDFPTIGSLSQRRYSSRPDFRLLNSVDASGTYGLTLAGGRLQPNGGGLNSTLTVDSVTAANPLEPGASIVIAIRFGVMRWGKHPFTATVEALQ